MYCISFIISPNFKIAYHDYWCIHFFQSKVVEILNNDKSEKSGPKIATNKHLFTKIKDNFNFFVLKKSDQKSFLFSRGHFYDFYVSIVLNQCCVPSNSDSV